MVNVTHQETTIKIHCSLVFIAIHLFCISTALFTMQEERKIVTVAVFDRDTAAIGSNKECVLIVNSQALKENQKVTYLNRYPTHNLIADKKNKRLGVFNKFGFVVYDIKTKEIFWSKKTYSDNCSAVFSPVDDTIFLCDNGHLSTNENISMHLPYTGSNKYFGIDCHPNKKEILYPCSNTTLAVYSFKNKTYNHYHPDIKQTDIIIRALYSPKGDHIALLTDSQYIFIYNLKNKSTIQVRSSLGPYYGCLNPIFIPHSNILFFLCYHGQTCFYHNIKNMKSMNENPYPGYVTWENSSALINKIDFSSDGSYILTATETITAKGSDTPGFLTKYLIYKKLFLCYQQLKLYSIQNGGFLIPDVISLFVKTLRIILKSDIKSTKN